MLFFIVNVFNVHSSMICGSKTLCLTVIHYFDCWCYCCCWL